MDTGAEMLYIVQYRKILYYNRCR